ncbi:MAG: hypothetical protein A2X25_00900 [Chloroflexi bacterium GWB2_49_20]|nr:MAG: hypothetical protein A2X25_00900 [Chloroflexi bacterium GWB2_49_20]OGN77530.1 MAG: hypothetical protein A2X26_02200 [Chloroflexi bacterium GWC2_49_37]OGN83207.1 MAG: hypothetical protein A2X27_13520 [Chloroflexi bacterium GWD2_49_16]
MTDELKAIPDMPEKPIPSRNKNGLKRAGGILLALLLLCLLAYSLRTPILTGLANYLISSDTPLEKADLIFVLNGDYNTRPFYASDLYQQRLAPLVIIAQAESSPAELMGLVDNPTDIAVEVMQRLGVPVDNLVVLNKNKPVTSTFDEARVLRQYIVTHDVQSVILVTSAFHTRRARWILDSELSGLPVRLEVGAAPHIGFDASNWWQNENGLINLNNEYIKLFFYWIKYR